MQLQQSTRSPETAQLGAPQRRAAEEANDMEAAKRGKLDVRNLNIKARGALYFSGAVNRLPDQ